MGTKIQIQILRSLSKDLLDEVGRLRVVTWKASPELAPGAFSEGSWTDEHDEHSWHWVVSHDSRVVASARLCLHDSLKEMPDYFAFPKDVLLNPKTDYPIACINRLVVHPDVQGLGIGSLLDRQRIEKSKDLGAKVVLVRAGERRVNSLLRQGFHILNEAEPDELLADGHFELFMMLRITLDS